MNFKGGQVILWQILTFAVTRVKRLVIKSHASEMNESCQGPAFFLWPSSAYRKRDDLVGRENTFVLSQLIEILSSSVAQDLGGGLEVQREESQVSRLWGSGRHPRSFSGLTRLWDLQGKTRLDQEPEAGRVFRFRWGRWPPRCLRSSALLAAQAPGESGGLAVSVFYCLPLFPLLPLLFYPLPSSAVGKGRFPSAPRWTPLRSSTGARCWEVTEKSALSVPQAGDFLTPVSALLPCLLDPSPQHTDML